MGEITLCFISDTHGMHDHVRVPPCDVLVHCGDCTNDGSYADLKDFLTWLRRQPAEHKVLIAGNHDWVFEKHPALATRMVLEYAPTVTYLQDSGVTLHGLKFWGSPITKRFMDWAFNRDPGEDIRRHWSLIPEGTDVLVTHGPPYGYLDLSRESGRYYSDTQGMVDCDHLGDRDLYEAVLRVKPSIHAFGHIHGSGGKTVTMIHDDGARTDCVNASICDEAYRPTRQPVVYYNVPTP
jgi:predicted phosphodiesterase